MPQQKNNSCPHGHGVMLRCFVKPSVNGKQTWKKVKWQYCNICGIVLPDDYNLAVWDANRTRICPS